MRALKYLFPILTLSALVFLIFILGAVYCHFPSRLCKQVDVVIEAIGSQKKINQLEKKQKKRPKAFVEKSLYQGVLVKDRWEDKSYQHYTVYTVENEIIAITRDGNVVHRWHLPVEKAIAFSTYRELMEKKPNGFIASFYVYPNGEVLLNYHYLGKTPYGSLLVKIDKDSNILWTYDQYVHHLIYVGNNDGHIYVLTQNFRKNSLSGLEHLNYPILEDHIVELSPEGKEIKTINLLEAFAHSKFKDSLPERKGDSGWDLTHTNSVIRLESELANAFPEFKVGDLLISMRNLNMLAVIDGHSHVIKKTYKGPWKGQHDAQFLKNGRILMFDNRGMAGRSRVIEIDPDSGKLVWSYFGNTKDRFMSTTHAQAQRLSNGHTFINASNRGHLLEIGPNKRLIWRYRVRNGKKGYERIAFARRYFPEELPFLQKYVE